MKVVIVYESMYGNTHQIAQAIARGFGSTDEVVVTPAQHADVRNVVEADLLIVGGPTHVHGMTRPLTRHNAVEVARQKPEQFTTEPEAEGSGVRELLDTLRAGYAKMAAFDTRMTGPASLTGRASKGISRRLRELGYRELVEPMSFLVTKETHLVDGEEERARQWGAQLAQLAQVGSIMA